MNDARLRASDADRDTVVGILNTAFGAGRITAEEHAERIEAALAAKTFGDLAPLTVDLVPQPEPSPPRRPSTPSFAAREPSFLQPVDDMISATLSKQERSGSWVVPRRLRVHALLGTVVLDFTQARLQDLTVDIECSLIMSTLKLRLPRGGRVRDGTSRFVSDDSTKQIGPFDERAPVILLTGVAAMSDVKVRGPRGHHLLDYLGF